MTDEPALRRVTRTPIAAAVVDFFSGLLADRCQRHRYHLSFVVATFRLLLFFFFSFSSSSTSFFFYFFFSFFLLLLLMPLLLLLPFLLLLFVLLLLLFSPSPSPAPSLSACPPSLSLCPSPSSSCSSGRLRTAAFIVRHNSTTVPSALGDAATVGIRVHLLLVCRLATTSRRSASAATEASDEAS